MRLRAIANGGIPPQTPYIYIITSLSMPRADVLGLFCEFFKTARRPRAAKRLPRPAGGATIGVQTSAAGRPPAMNVQKKEGFFMSSIPQRLAALRAAIKEKTHGMTVFIVSQRAASVQRADQILVLDDGKTAGLGTHAQLLKGCEVYREICLSQLSKEEVSRTL